MMNGPLSLSWKGVVLLYSSCQLTYDRDKLVALSGLARERSRLSGDEYMAGLWRTNLIGQLCWTRQQRTVTHGSNRPEGGYRALTWSWASLDGEISLFEDQVCHVVSLYAEVIDSKICHKSTEKLDSSYRQDDQFGEVASATLSIACRSLLRALPYAVTMEDGNLFWKIDHRAIELKVTWDCVEEFDKELFFLTILES
jgi:hypothetical protein